MLLFLPFSLIAFLSTKNALPKKWKIISKKKKIFFFLVKSLQIVNKVIINGFKTPLGFISKLTKVFFIMIFFFFGLKSHII